MFSQRQNIIINTLILEGRSSIREILSKINIGNRDISKVTLLRDIDKLIQSGYVNRTGIGRSIRYNVGLKGKFLFPVEIGKYFKVEQDDRGIFENFNIDIFQQLKNLEIFNEKEKEEFTLLRDRFHKNIQKLSNKIITKEFERITIELSWKSSHIEGNTYTLLDTERLLNDDIQADGKLPEEALMLLNHKYALEFIREQSASFKEISISDVIRVHELLVRNLDIKFGLRNSLVRITGTNYKPLDNDAQIEDAVNLACKIVNNQPDLLTKAFLMFSLIPYIQPFDDGNKRTSRLIANAILLANNSFPLAFRSIDEGEYKLGTLLFYEKNNISKLKELFLEQIRFAANEYFQIKA